jgi:hypothetical protein
MRIELPAGDERTAAQIMARAYLSVGTAHHASWSWRHRFLVRRLIVRIRHRFEVVAALDADTPSRSAHKNGHAVRTCRCVGRLDADPHWNSRLFEAQLLSSSTH